jgi:hypothetical protein
MIKLDNVTLVCVTCVNVERAIDALNYSCKDIDYGDVILLTDKDVSVEGINTFKIPNLDYIGYSKFIVYDLFKFINTDYVLIIQDDGFVINPSEWSDVFFKYDYIGAPFPLPPSGDMISYRDPFGVVQRVGNGGFSFRSKKILELPTTLELEWKSYFGYWNEDGFFAVHNKHILEENGCIFAPIDIASDFSIEHDTNETLGKTSFGFHGKHNKHYNKI